MADAALKDHAAEYIRQIRESDDERALLLMKEFGEKAYRDGWQAAAKSIRDYAGELTGK